jgi:hypothetical protein
MERSSRGLHLKYCPVLPVFTKIFHRIILSALSKASSKSIKSVSRINSRLFSINCFDINALSKQKLPFLNSCQNGLWPILRSQNLSIGT